MKLKGELNQDLASSQTISRNLRVSLTLPALTDTYALCFKHLFNIETPHQPFSILLNTLIISILLEMKPSSAVPVE